MPDLLHAKRRMIDAHLRRRGISSEAVLRAMEKVPRERFVDAGYEEFAYEDTPLAIGEGQTISQPYIVALMLEKAEIQPDDTVLEIGTGSGYAAAVASQLAAHVYTVERHASLAETARRRFAMLGFKNIDVRVGDGAQGWPQAGPFDAILVAAAGNAIPAALTEQLDLGGRLVIPVGDIESQRLLKITRTSASTFHEEDLGAVRFVPLVSEEALDSRSASKPVISKSLPLPRLIASAAEPLPDLDDPEFGRAFDRFADRRIVLLGESSHGTSEFYRARAAITRRLIERHGFTIVAVEADWPDAAIIDRHVRQRARADAMRAGKAFQRFPTWMWRNREFQSFVEWLAQYNAARPEAQKAGFYGLDLYNLCSSIASVLSYLDKTAPEAAAIARERYACLTPWQNDPATYGRAVITASYEGCEEQVAAQLRDLLSDSLELSRNNGDDYLDAVQSARLVSTAERYYRVMYYGGPAAWNLRDDHMFETLSHLLEAKGRQAKAVVWAHNSHIGDARATDMSISRDEINLGQRCREHFGDEAALIGFGTHGGHVAAASEWDGEMEIKPINPALSGSYEALFHEAGIDRHLVDFSRHAELKERLAIPKLERFIGVIYRPETERGSHYASASISRQFDAFVWMDETSPVVPFDPENVTQGAEDTYPFGL